jgi:predicted RND superfamily exporter protein
VLSPFPANAQLGILRVLGLVNCFVVSVLLLPVLLNTPATTQKNN